MIIYIVVHDKSGNRHNFSVNARSLDHAVRKAEKVCVKFNIWHKRIEAFKPHAIVWQYRDLPFTLAKIK